MCEENNFFCGNASKNNIKLKKYYAEKFIKTTGIEIQGQHWGGKGNYQWKLLLLNIFQIHLIQVTIKKINNLIHT